MIDPAEWQTFRLCAETVRGADALLDFVPMVSPRLERPEHLRPLAEVFARAEYEPVRACTSVPPQHGKTETIFHCLVRYLLRHPERTCVYAAYSYQFAESKSRRLLDIADAAGLPIRRDIRRLHEWRLPQGGGMLITSVEGSLIGQAVDGILVVDDPYSGREAAESPVKSRSVIDWFNGTAMMRLHPTSSVIVNMTRWSVGDLIGHLTNAGGWEIVNIPAINDKGEALWPSKRPLEFLEKHRRRSEYEWAAQFLGMPRPRGLEVFHEPARYQESLNAGITVIACDPATTAKTSADFSAIVVGVADMQQGFPVMDVIDVRALQVETPALVRELIGVQRKYRAPIVIESVGGFKGVPQALRSIDRELKIHEVTPVSDKFVRAQPVAGAWNDGRVRMPMPGSPKYGPWVEPFVDECRAFTGVNDPHDDRVDALSHCFNTLETALKRRASYSRRLEALSALG